MRIVSAASDEVLPSQWSYDPAFVRALVDGFDERKAGALYCVSTPTGKYLLFNGHHRALARHLRGEPHPLHVLETDEEVRACTQYPFSGMESVHEAQQQYLLFGTQRRAHGIVTLDDLARHGVMLARS